VIPSPPDADYWREEAGALGAVGGSEIDAYPYVSLTLNTDA
jgi:hypothetical protein